MNEFMTGFYNVATSKGRNPDALLVDSMLSASPVLKHVEWTPANRETQHIFREVADVQGIEIIDFDAPLPAVKASFSLAQANLTPLGGLLQIGDDLARQVGGHEAYFKEQGLLFAKEAGCKLEASYFDRILKTAIEKGKAFEASDSDKPLPAVVVATWQPGETCALYSSIYSLNQHLP